MKGTVQAGAAVTNKFRLVVPGLPETYWTRFGELTRELVTAEMSDRTVQSTGDVKPGEVDADQYMHHADERVALEAWFAQCAVAAPGYKRAGELYFHGADGQPVAAYTLVGLFTKGPKTPELNRGQDGEGVQITWMFSYDDVLPL